MDDNTVNIVITATDNASKIIAAVRTAFDAVSGVVKDVTSEYIAYGDQVKQLSAFTGVNSEETSRMIQLADDAFVSFETLRMALKKMADDGLVPNTANMAKLSDEFLKIQDPAARSQFLLDHFGRSGIEMAKIMELGGKKITEMSKSISDSLIIDDEKAARIKETKQRLDEFNDAITGMKYDTADKLLDIFQGMPKPLQDAVQYLNLLTSTQVLGTLSQLAVIFTSLRGGGAAAGGAAAAAGAAGAAGTGGAGAAAGAAGVGLATKIFAPLAAVWEIGSIIKNIGDYSKGMAMPGQGGMFWQGGRVTGFNQTQRRTGSFAGGSTVVNVAVNSTDDPHSMANKIRAAFNLLMGERGY